MYSNLFLKVELHTLLYFEETVFKAVGSDSSYIHVCIKAAKINQSGYCGGGFLQIFRNSI